MKHRVPSGWDSATVEQTLDVRYGKALPPERRGSNGTYPVLGSAGEMARTDEALASGSVVIIGRKGNVGSVQLCLGGAWPIDTTYFFEVPELFEPRFLELQLACLGMDQLDSSTATPSLRRQDLEAQTLVWPPRRVQRRIVELLEDHLSRLDAAEAYVDACQRRADHWHAGCLSRAVWQAQCPTAAVGDLLREPMRNGRSDRAVKDGESGTRTLTLTAVTRNEFTDANTKLTVTPPRRAEGLWLEPGDVLVQRANTPELVGTAARYDGQTRWAIFPDLLIRLRADESKVDSRFLTAALRSEEGHNQLRRRAKGLAGSMPKIDQATIAAAVVPVPELRVQSRVLQQLQSAEVAANSLRSELERISRRIAALRRSLLAAAFSGQLTGAESDLSELEEMIDG